MISWLLRVVANACGLAAAAQLFSGIWITGSTTKDRIIVLVVVALIFGIVNEIVRPIVAFLSFPLARQFSIGFHVHGFWTAVFGSIVVSVVSWLVGLLLPESE
jgi:putative membrane protein